MKPSDWTNIKDGTPPIEHSIENGNPTWSAPYVLVATDFDDSGARVAFYDPEENKWFSHNYSEVYYITHWMLIVLPEKE